MFHQTRQSIKTGTWPFWAGVVVVVIAAAATTMTTATAQFNVMGPTWVITLLTKMEQTQAHDFSSNSYMLMHILNFLLKFLRFTIDIIFTSRLYCIFSSSAMRRRTNTRYEQTERFFDQSFEWSSLRPSPIASGRVYLLDRLVECSCFRTDVVVLLSLSLFSSSRSVVAVCLWATTRTFECRMYWRTM